MGVARADRGGGTVAERLPVQSQSVPLAASATEDRLRISPEAVNDVAAVGIKENETFADIYVQTGLMPVDLRQFLYQAGYGMPPLEHVIYSSVAAQDFEASQLAELLEKARKANESAGLTGMLLYTESDGSFFQVVEGEPGALDQLLAKLLLDKRHSHVTLIIREPIVERSFEAWTMGFSSVSPDKLRKIPGLNDFFKGGSCLTALDAGRAKKLLDAFAKGRWRAKIIAPIRKGT